MTIISAAFTSNSTGQSPPFSYNVFNSTQNNAVAQISSDLIDNTNTSTGVTLDVTTVFPSVGFFGGGATADAGDFPEYVLGGHWRTGNGTSSQLTIGNLPVGASYTLQLIGHQNDPDRDVLFTVEGSSQEYLVGPVSAPTTALSFSGTVDSAGELVIDVQKTATGEFYGYINGFILEYTVAPTSETATTGNIPLVIQAGYTKVDLVNPVTTNASLLFGYIGDAPVTGDDLEYDVTSVLDSGVTFSVAADGVWTVTEAVDGDWTTNITVDRRVVQVDGTIGATATMTFDATVLSNLTIDTSPSEIRTTEAFSFTVNSVTVPTTGNTTGNFSGLTGIAPSSVTGSGPYVITWTLPVGTSKLFSGTGYVFDITVDVDTVSSSEVPYLPVTGFSYVDLVSPVASEFTTSYSGTTPVTGDQAVYSTSTTPSGITVSVRSDLSWAIASSPASNQISKFYIVKADTTTGPTDNVIWSAP